MTPDKAEALLRAMLLSLASFRDQAEVVANLHPGCADAVHLLASLKQAHMILGDLMKPD